MRFGLRAHGVEISVSCVISKRSIEDTRLNKVERVGAVASRRVLAADCLGAPPLPSAGLFVVQWACRRYNLPQYWTPRLRPERKTIAEWQKWTLLRCEYSFCHGVSICRTITCVHLDENKFLLI